MTARERMMTAMRKGVPDRCPVAPDTSNMIPAKLTGKPFWDIYLHNDPPLWQAYINTVKRYGFDGWFIYGQPDFNYEVQCEKTTEILEKNESRVTVRTTYHTPAGDLTDVAVFPAGDPPTPVEKVIKNIEKDFEKVNYLLQTPIGYDAKVFNQQREAIGELGVMGINLPCPGLQSLVGLFDGGLESLIYAMSDFPELVESLNDRYHDMCIKQCEFAIEAGVDSVLLGASGSITLASPELWRKLALPAIKTVTQMCRDAGVISGLHSCGYEMYIVETCAKETALDYINPLEIPPMGDSTLSKARETVGAGMCLMGNLHTTEVMLNGTPELVRLESLKALLDAGQDGAFILSSGDQCGRDTPEENIRAMIEAMEEHGKYPLDVERIQAEIERLKR